VLAQASRRTNCESAQVTDTKITYVDRHKRLPLPALFVGWTTQNALCITLIPGRPDCGELSIHSRWKPMDLSWLFTR